MSHMGASDSSRRRGDHTVAAGILGLVKSQIRLFHQLARGQHRRNSRGDAEGSGDIQRFPECFSMKGALSIAARRRSATAAAISGEVSGITTTNSSPP